MCSLRRLSCVAVLGVLALWSGCGGVADPGPLPGVDGGDGGELGEGTGGSGDDGAAGSTAAGGRSGAAGANGGAPGREGMDPELGIDGNGGRSGTGGSGSGGTGPGGMGGAQPANTGGTDSGSGGTSEPGTGGTESGSGGTSEPGAGGSDPGAGGSDPGAGGSDPGAGGTESSAGAAGGEGEEGGAGGESSQGGSGGQGGSDEPPPIVDVEVGECAPFEACGGDVEGVWTYTAACVDLADLGVDEDAIRARCAGADFTLAGQVSGTLTFADGVLTRQGRSSAQGQVFVPGLCAVALGGCAGVEAELAGAGISGARCAAQGVFLPSCRCNFALEAPALEQVPFVIEGDVIQLADGRELEYCAVGDNLGYREIGTTTEPGVRELERR